MKSGQPNKHLFSLTFRELNGLLSACTRSNRRHTGERSKTMDINPSLQIFGWYMLVHRRNRSWIKGLGKDPQKSELVHCWQCLLSGATEPWTHGLRETSRAPRMPWCEQGSRQNTKKLECTFRRSPISCSKNNCVVYTASDVNWLSLI